MIQFPRIKLIVPGVMYCQSFILVIYLRTSDIKWLRLSDTVKRFASHWILLFSFENGDRNISLRLIACYYIASAHPYTGSQ